MVRMEGWKKFFIRAAGFGTGFAVMLAIIAGLFFWWADRPTPPKPWNKNAIKAKYVRVQEIENQDIVFFYELENTTDTDYTLEKGGETVVNARLGSGALAPCESAECIKMHFPL